MKILAIILILSAYASKSDLNKYAVKEIPSNVEGTLWIEKEYCEKDTVQTLGKTFVIIKKLEK